MSSFLCSLISKLILPQLTQHYNFPVIFLPDGNIFNNNYNHSRYLPCATVIFIFSVNVFLCLSCFSTGLRFSAAVCKCAGSTTWIVQFLTNLQADSWQSSSDASSENTTAFECRLHGLCNRTFPAGSLHKSAEPSVHTEYTALTVSRTIRHLSGTCSADFSCPGCSLCEKSACRTTTISIGWTIGWKSGWPWIFLSESLDPAKNGANWYCYEEPLTPTTGLLQSQIPILLAEYTFGIQGTSQITCRYCPTFHSIFWDQRVKEKAAAGRLCHPLPNVWSNSAKDFTADLNSHYLVATFNEKTDAISELSKNERALSKPKIATFWNPAGISGIWTAFQHNCRITE